MASEEHVQTSQAGPSSQNDDTAPVRARARARDRDVAAAKRKCVSTACIACRRRKSKCDGNLPSCAACSSVYGTECVYDPASDHRRKGVYRNDVDDTRSRTPTLQILLHGILNYPDEEVAGLVRDIRASENLEEVAEGVVARGLNPREEANEEHVCLTDDGETHDVTFERALSRKMGGLQLGDGTSRFLGGTSVLLFDDPEASDRVRAATASSTHEYVQEEDAIRSWTTVTDDVDLIIHLLNMYFSWHYQYFTTLSKDLFFQDFYKGNPFYSRPKVEYCTPLLVNAMLALGCHFTAWPAARSDPQDSSTTGDHFFKEAKRLIVDDDEYEHPKLATVQALALMSVREAGCAREAKGWVYSGMSFRMASDLGLNVKGDESGLGEHEIDARRVTFWGCFLFDKCWSNYMGRPPQLPLTNITVPKFEVFPSEDSKAWQPWTDDGPDHSCSQPARTRASALLLSALCEISNDILLTFYRPGQEYKNLSKQAEIKKLSELHTRLEGWRKQVPKELEPREGQLPHVLLMHMFFNLLFIHLFRPFLKYAQPNGPLPPQVNPRRVCTHGAAMISKLLRFYKKTYGLRQICNVAVYIAHSACTIHTLNLPDKDATRDITYSFRHLEEIAAGWLCARRTLVILGVQARMWHIELPEEAVCILQRVEHRYGSMASPRPNGDGDTMHQLDSSIMPAPALPSNGGYEVNLTPGVDDISGTSQAEMVLESIEADTPYVTNTYGEEQDDMRYLTEGPVGTMSLAPVSGQPRASRIRGPNTATVDGRDWWLRDQSSIFDSWSSGENVGVSEADGFQPSASFPLGIGGTAEAGQLDGFGGVEAVKHEDFMADGFIIEYLDFR